MDKPSPGLRGVFGLSASLLDTGPRQEWIFYEAPSYTGPSSVLLYCLLLTLRKHLMAFGGTYKNHSKSP